MFINKDTENISSIHSHKMPLPIDQIEIYLSEDRKSMLVSCFEYPKGARHWDVFNWSEFSNQLITTCNSKHLGIVSIVE